MKIIKWILRLILLILVIFFVWFCWLYDFKGESILIPKGFLGEVNIYYDRQDGIPAKLSKNERIIYVIPNSGILRVNFKDYLYRNTPIQNRKYFLYDLKTGKITNEFVKSNTGKYSVVEYMLDGFKYGTDSSGKNGENYYFDSFEIITCR